MRCTPVRRELSAAHRTGLESKACVSKHFIFYEVLAATRQSRQPLRYWVQQPAKTRCSAARRCYVDLTVAYTRIDRWQCMTPEIEPLPALELHKETGMTTYFTIGDLILVIPMALAGALFVGALPCKTEFRHNALRVLGALIGVVLDRKS